jgi:hypothetical protein
MPYSKPKKRKCRKADGSSGSWVVDKGLSSGKTEQSSCHDSEDKASASIRARKANEVDVPYGEEINEDITRILVKEFTLSEAIASRPDIVDKVIKLLKSDPLFTKVAQKKVVGGKKEPRVELTNLGSRGQRLKIVDLLKRSGQMTKY